MSNKSTVQQFFWVNHSKKHHEREIKDGILVSGVDGKTKRSYREMLGQACVGDVIFICYQQVIGYVGVVTSHPTMIDDWNDTGIPHWRVGAIFKELKHPINITEHASHLVKIKRDYLAPIDKNGKPIQGAYISNIDLDMASYLMAKSDIYVKNGQVFDIKKGASDRILNLKSFLSSLTVKNIKETLKLFSSCEPERFCYNDSTIYDLVHEGHRYPPKVVFGFSALYVMNRVLHPDEFTGGVDSESFGILQGLGFHIEPKKNVIQRPILFDRYSRKEISQLFEPGCKFSPGAGRWGGTGIVWLNNQSQDVVFMVTLEKISDANPYSDSLSDDGMLRWESQTQMGIDSDRTLQLISHDFNTSNIHLFLRSDKKNKYSYLGLLAYEWHDENSSNPVLFKWRLIHAAMSSNLSKQLGEDSVVSTIAPKCNELIEEFDPDTFSLNLVNAPEKKVISNKTKTTDIQKKKSEPDWAAVDERNRTLGDRGELLVMVYESERLRKAGRNDLAAKVERISAVDSSAGYDIKSFDSLGNEILIEVKTTTGGIHTPFYISLNELSVAAKNQDRYYLYRVHDLNIKSKTGGIYLKQGSVEEIFELEAINFRAKVK
ncbi:DUF3427 domain-containing protein [Yersinia proxima]|uniref:DUF3427 domain-containing protein n=1 Tax=Yersinia proxima TaxID=2890316 RepID=UPI001D10D387|nr:DUF3427 domain-containing protein [Yersinia proxima]